MTAHNLSDRCQPCAAAPPALIERFLQFAWIPLLRCRHPSLDTLHSQIVEEFAAAVAPTQPWNVIKSAIARCVGSLPLTFTFPQGQQPDGRGLLQSLVNCLLS